MTHNIDKSQPIQIQSRNGIGNRINRGGQENSYYSYIIYIQK